MPMGPPREPEERKTVAHVDTLAFTLKTMAEYAIIEATPEEVETTVRFLRRMASVESRDFLFRAAQQLPEADSQDCIHQVGPRAADLLYFADKIAQAQAEHSGEANGQTRR